MKTCTACHQAKEMDKFGLQKSWNGKRYPKAVCKACCVAKSKKWAEENPEKRKAIWRHHAEENRGAYQEANRRYYQRNSEERRRRLKLIWERDPQKKEARKLVRLAVLRGELKKTPCESCGDSKVQAHHRDYSKPLEVRWLCSICHGKEHRRDRAA